MDLAFGVSDSPNLIRASRLLLRRRDYAAAVCQPGDSFDVKPSVRGERSLCSVGDLYHGHAPVVAAGKAPHLTGNRFAIGRPRRAGQKKIGECARCEFLLARAVCTHYHYCVFGFTEITTHKRETFSVRREANAAYVFQQLLGCTTEHRNLMEHSRYATSFVAKIVNVVSIRRKS